MTSQLTNSGRAMKADADAASLLGELRIDREARPPTPVRPWGRWISIACAAVLCASLGWMAIQQPKAAPMKAAVPAAPVTAPTPAAGSLLEASGYVVARRRATVSSKVTGRVVSVLIEEGRQVEAGAVIARLDDSNYRSAVRQADAQLAQVQATLQAARTAARDAEPIYSRHEKQLAAGVISAQAFDTARATYNATRTALLVAESALESARVDREVALQELEDTVVTAPFAGVVTEQAAQPGEVVSPMSGAGGFTRTGICTIVDMGSLEVEVDVGESYINRVQQGQPVEVELNAYPGWRIAGEVLATIPAADRAKATVRARIALKVKDARIIPDMGVRVSFLQPSADVDEDGADFAHADRADPQQRHAAAATPIADATDLFVRQPDALQTR